MNNKKGYFSLPRRLKLNAQYVVYPFFSVPFFFYFSFEFSKLLGKE